ncbi:hypothetical protein [Pseudoalteromonas xiamenensis]
MNTNIESVLDSNGVLFVEGVRYLYNPETGEAWTKKTVADYVAKLAAEREVVMKEIEPEAAALPVYELNDIQVSAVESAQTVELGNGGIYWLPTDTAFTITANAKDVPDNRLMVMVEKVVDATRAIDDERFVATVKKGKLSLTGSFDKTGNYTLSAKRLNEGLERIEMPFRVSFPTVEFDVYRA